MKIIVKQTLTIEWESIFDANSIKEAHAVAKQETRKSDLLKDLKPNSQVDLNVSAWPQFLSECHHCHAAEAFHNLPWCLDCAREHYSDKLAQYLAIVEECMKIEARFCERCNTLQNECAFYTRPSTLNIVVLCKECLPILAQQDAQSDQE